jgi:Rv0078B-related antitoxin
VVAPRRDPGGENLPGDHPAGAPRATPTAPAGDEVVSDAMAAVLRAKTPTERLAIGFNLWTFAQTMLRETLRRDNPHWDEAELARQVARRMSHGAGFRDE